MEAESRHILSGEEYEKQKKYLDGLGYEELPPDMKRAAKHVLKDRASAFVSKSSGGKLSKYAAKRARRKSRGK